MGLESLEVSQNFFHNKQEEVLDMENKNKIDSELLNKIVDEEKKGWEAREDRRFVKTGTSVALIHIIIYEYLGRIKEEEKRPSRSDLFREAVARLKAIGMSYNKDRMREEWERLKAEEEGKIENEKVIKKTEKDVKIKGKGHIGNDLRMSNDP